MECGNCGSHSARYFTHLGVTSVRCPDCGADLMPGVIIQQDGYDKGECLSCYKLNRLSECDCKWYRDYIDGQHLEMAIQVLQEKLDFEKSPGGWISVKDRLPEQCLDNGHISEKVLIAQGVNDKQIQFGWYRGYKKKEWVHSDMEPFARQDLITHWMLLPEPPKEESQSKPKREE